MSLEQITSFSQCVSTEERKQRFGVALANLFIWLALIAACVLTMGFLLLFLLVAWLINYMLAESQVRQLQALGVTVSPWQFPQVAEALAEVCQRFRVSTLPRVIVVNVSQTNALAVRFARKRVLLIFSELLEAIINDPRELRAILGHELCHTVLDHGARGVFEMYKPPRYKAAREMTCDNAGVVAAGDLEAAKTVLKKLCVGKHLFASLSEQALVAEAEQIYSGLVGWWLRRTLTYPPTGARMMNLDRFAQEA
jgi:Zn-dependent protease with chaperone function